MLGLEDEKWLELQGGYRIPYDASVALRSMQNGIDVWDERWEELHHQGDVGVASYTAVPHIVRIAEAMTKRERNFYGLVTTIEVERHRKGNPAIPEWLKSDYADALARASALAFADMASEKDDTTIRAMLSLIALTKGEVKLGAMLSGLDSSELDEWLEDRLAWSELYEECVRLAPTD